MSCIPPFPHSGHYLQSIRDSCRSLREKNEISITSQSIDRLLDSESFTNSFSRVSQAHGLNLPLKYSSHLDELNVLAVLSLLNFGSGYRTVLHERTGRGAWNTMTRLVLSMYLSGSHLTAKDLQSLSPSEIAGFLNVQLYKEEPHAAYPEMVVGQPDKPMLELVQLIQQALNTTGTRLVEGGYPSLGAFVVECLKEGDRAGAVVETALEKIVRAFPAFQDMAFVDNEPVYCFKKALFLLQAVVIRFGSLSPSPFPIPSTSDLPVFSDNVLPSMLIHLGVIDLSSSTVSSLFAGSVTSDTLTARLGNGVNSDTNATATGPPPEGPVLTQREAFVLRAAAIDACELIVERAQEREFPWGKLNLPLLDVFIWAVAKDRADYRRLPRFALKDTLFF